MYMEIIHNGINYQIVEREPFAGDYIIINRSLMGAPQGSIYKLFKFSGELFFQDDNGDLRDVLLYLNDEVSLIEPFNGEYQTQIDALTARIAQLERKLSDKAESQADYEEAWLRIGRKVGEFRKGDVVEDMNSGVTVVEEVEPEGFLNAERGLTLENGHWTFKHYCILIAPAESVVNLRVK
jgi:hypothetical protein